VENVHGREVIDMADPIGEIIDLSEQVAGSRGATAKFDDELLAILVKVFKSDQAAKLNGEYIVTQDGKDEDTFKNERQAVGANIRKHGKRVIAENESLTGKVSLQWHPVTGQPQVSLKKT
jgi:phage gp45-like